MKSNTVNEFVPKALREVWEWKESIYQETKHLSTTDALRFVSAEGEALRKTLNLSVADLSHTAIKIAEPGKPYGV